MPAWLVAALVKFKAVPWVAEVLEWGPIVVEAGKWIWELFKKPFKKKEAVVDATKPVDEQKGEP